MSDDGAERSGLSLGKIIVGLLALAIAGGAGIGLYSLLGGAKPATQAPVKEVNWVAAAPGRVEPLSGEYRISAAMPGRIAEVPVAVNGFVEQDEILLRLDDEEVRARLTAAETEASVRRRERDAQALTQGREDINKAEDAFYAAARAATNARFEVDFALAARRIGTAGADGMLANSMKRLTDARDRLQRERASFATAQVKPNLPAPNRGEAALTAARAEVDIAEAMLQRTRVRSPITGTVLTLNARVGETVTPSPEQIVAVIGNAYLLRVRAEVDEADAGKLKRDQRAFVRSSAYPGRDFEARISSIAPTLAGPKLGNRGARRPTDVEVLEVLVDLDGSVPLLPGMRVDVYFRRD
jgi:HlyD family secretion protein